ncbi:Metallo-hydrolase/oxidoreductase [Fragilariopsis cylindrus CCMP1102]|uniref:ribonuclease Z n=1 Tax=Fragilariopsis cylindrus CCMP1102 TaxID=635003 RepID=A0A1E7FQV5_9STRA|nr:Metallo-hydrolase/oxidoreductase [Fragilariopsis cylindrus CCMP1102]|eukprot:OEU20485.1 Metallo-hydrolase/oxidoreductase [Fragilariopsis cylindrus CCMP1102]
MTSCVRVLSIQALDSFSSILLVSPNGKKTLVNCGDGCQRIFLEFGQKVSTVDRICLTHLGHETIGGLPGMILTSSDVIKQATEKSKSMLKSKISSGGGGVVVQKQQGKQRQPPPPGPGLTIVGPNGTQKFLRSLRHFMRRDSFRIEVQEGAYNQSATKCGKGDIKNSNHTDDDSSFLVQSIAAYTTKSDNSTTDSTIIQSKKLLSFLFTTPPIAGKFLIEKAKALGIPKGPLYRRLKAGETITFPNPSSSDKTVTVESHQVVEPSSPGVVVAVLCYPSLDVLNQLQKSNEMKQFQRQEQQQQGKDNITTDDQNHDKRPVLELIVHMTSREIFESNTCSTWRKSYYGSCVRHLFVRTETATGIDRVVTPPCDDSESLMSPFHSAHSGAQLRSMVCPYIEREETTKDEESNVVYAVPLLEYVLLPRPKRGFQNGDACNQHRKELKNDAQVLLNTSGCLDRANQLLENDRVDNKSHCTGGEILFTGTGSAVPCKHRNVSGIYVRMENGNSMLLDTGEGTIGQLLRAKQQQKHRGIGEESLATVLKNIKAVWISHPHADHHLGIIRLLEERKRLVSDSDPIVLIAPPNLLYFLKEYELIEPRVVGSYMFLDCRTLTTNSNNDRKTSPKHHETLALQRLKDDLGIHSCTSIPVAHCAHSFAVVFHGTAFGSLAYSGDCRPSENFAKIAYNADLLIHEATFANGLEADAVVKRHCTVGEALRIATKMNAKTTVLTHFSQRYPKIPELDFDNALSLPSGMKVIPAFDFMVITPTNIASAAMLTPALQLLYPDDSDDAMGDDTMEKSEAQAALEVPGLFAQSELL